jgi:hypothetical protein
VFNHSRSHSYAAIGLSLRVRLRPSSNGGEMTPILVKGGRRWSRLMRNPRPGNCS